MKSTNKVMNGLSLIVVSAILAGSMSACGSKSAATATNSGAALTGTGTTLPNNPATGNINGLPPAPDGEYTVTGPNGTKTSATPPGALVTESLLKIKVSALPATHLTIPNYNNWSFPYGCMSVKVKVNGVTKTTVAMKVPGMPQSYMSPCKDSPESVVLDFSSGMTGAPQALNITFEAGNYDNCRLDTYHYGYYGYQYYGCSLAPVWKNHIINFAAQIQTNGTWME